MRVLQLIDSLQTGGAERMAVNYANLLSRDCTSFICVTRKEGLLKQNTNADVKYLFLNKRKVFDFKAFTKLKAYVKTHDIQIIHAHSTSFFLATLLKFFNRNIKLIWHDHYGNSEFLQLRNFKVLKLCSYYFNAIISVNDKLKKWSETNLKCAKVYYLDNFAVSNGKENKETQLKGKGKKIVCLANLRIQKNHFMLIEAFKAVLKHSEGWTLHLIGVDNNDDYSKKLKHRIKSLQLDDNVFIYGKKNDVNNILSQCAIGVLSSSSEGLPLSLLEYGLAKLPVVATNVGDCAKVITNKNQGVLVPPNSVDTMAKSILEFINDAALRQQTGEQLYKHVVKNFSAQSILNQLISIYKRA